MIILRTIVTEFGKALVAKTAWAVSRVEYVKTSHLFAEKPGKSNEKGKPDSGATSVALDQIVVLHAGADLFVRRAYAPQKFSLRLTVHSSDGKRLQCKSADSSDGILTDIGLYYAQPFSLLVGPLCFSGDKLATAELFPAVSKSDVIVMHDVGGNSINLWSRHCSRQCPVVYGYHSSGGFSWHPALFFSILGENQVNYVLLKEKESLEDLLAFWNMGYDENAFSKYIREQSL